MSIIGRYRPTCWMWNVLTCRACRTGSNGKLFVMYNLFWKPGRINRLFWLRSMEFEVTKRVPFSRPMSIVCHLFPLQLVSILSSWPLKRGVRSRDLPSPLPSISQRGTRCGWAVDFGGDRTQWQGYQCHDGTRRYGIVRKPFSDSWATLPA